MANNYVQGTISPFLPLTEAQAVALVSQVDDLPEEGDEDATEGEKLALQWAKKYGLEYGTGIDVEDDYEGPWKDRKKTGLCYLYVENGLEEGTPEVLQEILQGLPGEYTHISYEAASYCAKMRPGEFGGHACFITRDYIEWMSTSGWLHKRLAEGEEKDG